MKKINTDKKLYTAVVIGATGLVGKELVSLLLQDPNFSQVRILVRKKTKLEHYKLKEFIVDFDNIDKFSKNIGGDVLFSCLGTTLSQAGSKKAQYHVDYTYQYQVAKIAAKNNIFNYVLVSSPFAKENSRNYYQKMKFDLEASVTKLPFHKIILIKPNSLKGTRVNKRNLEKMGVFIIEKIIKFFPFLNKYKPIFGKNVAKAMLSSFYQGLRSENNIHIYERLQVEDISKSLLF